MIVIWGMVTACLASVLAITSIVDAAIARAVVTGMVGPLVSACATWIVIDRALRTEPAALTRRLIAGFLVKVVLFSCYAFVAVKMFGVSVRPFAISFSAYFIVLHQAEALLLRRRSARVSHTLVSSTYR